jgi:hypothetical protein
VCNEVFLLFLESYETIGKEQEELTVGGWFYPVEQSAFACDDKWRRSASFSTVPFVSIIIAAEI